MKVGIFLLIGLCLGGRVQLTSKYGIEISASSFEADINRLTNQLWKLIPMRENDEDWKNHLENVILEITGLNQIIDFNDKFLILLSKLEGLKIYTVEFNIYRKTVFESISLLRELNNVR